LTLTDDEAHVLRSLVRKVKMTSNRHIKPICKALNAALDEGRNKSRHEVYARLSGCDGESDEPVRCLTLHRREETLTR
jgi:hypothetical protein